MGLAEHRGVKLWRGDILALLYFTLLTLLTLLYLPYFTLLTLLYWIEADTNPGLESLTKKKWARMIEGGG